MLAWSKGGTISIVDENEFSILLLNIKTTTLQYMFNNPCLSPLPALSSYFTTEIPIGQGSFIPSRCLFELSFVRSSNKSNEKQIKTRPVHVTQTSGCRKLLTSLSIRPISKTRVTKMHRGTLILMSSHNRSLIFPLATPGGSVYLSIVIVSYSESPAAVNILVYPSVITTSTSSC